MRTPSSRRRRRLAANLVGVLLLAGVVAVAAWVLARNDSGTRVVLSPVGINGIRIPARDMPRYPRNDPWRAYLAPEARCPGGEAQNAPIQSQRETMLCLLNWARRKHRLLALSESPALSQAALLKAKDIFRCREFAHDACGKEPSTAARLVGYEGRVWGENLYAGPLHLGAPRVALDGWLNSPGHRENLFRASWKEQGIAVVRAPSFMGQPEVAIWVSQFGAH